jgi:hypothetical protein
MYECARRLKRAGACAGGRDEVQLIDTFPTKLREELEAAFEHNIEDVFDVASVCTPPQSFLGSPRRVYAFTCPLLAMVACMNSAGLFYKELIRSAMLRDPQTLSYHASSNALRSPLA